MNRLERIVSGNQASESADIRAEQEEGAETVLPSITVVVIGLNEELHLDSVFHSIRNQSYPLEKLELIYVDSGSSDRSVEIAKMNADKVLIAKSPYPTAARGRNRGLAEASHPFVHFVDGDTELGPDYLRAAIDKMLADESLAGVVGYIDEKNSRDNGLNRLYSSVLSKKGEGFVTQAKAGGTFRTELLRNIGGYDERIKLGEETELGDRILSAGYKIFQVRDTMGVHDYDFRGLPSLTGLYVKMGESLAIQSRLSGEGKYWESTRRRNARNVATNLALLILVLACCYTGTFLPLIVLCFGVLGWPAIKLSARRNLNFNTLVYYEIMELMKPVTFWGQLRAYTRLATDPEFRDHVMVPKSN